LRNHRYLAIATVLFLFSAPAAAVELGAINVGSHLSEAFHAEVPLALNAGEDLSKLSVEVAAPAEYRILKVHRDQALNAIRTDVEWNGRGSRIVLSSRYLIDAPFFILVLKVRYGHATHYKKYPIFLDAFHAAQPAKAVSAETVKERHAVAAVPSPATSLMIEDSATEEKATHETSSAFKPFDSWARTSHYGPIVYGDSIHTVADRLRIDERYTIKQVMAALYEKNRSKFAQDNLHLVLYGAYLDVPMAGEVEQRSYDQALSMIQDHNRRWKELVKQPRYAAIAEAQKTRYSKRERVAGAVQAAKAASGMPATPVSGQ
jgi:pilus assembly protein FimV